MSGAENSTRREAQTPVQPPRTDASLGNARVGCKRSRSMRGRSRQERIRARPRQAAASWLFCPRRRIRPARPSSDEPGSQTDAGSGTGDGFASEYQAEPSPTILRSIPCTWSARACRLLRPETVHSTRSPSMSRFGRPPSPRGWPSKKPELRRGRPRISLASSCHTPKVASA